MTEGYVGVKFKTLFEGVDFDYENERRDIIDELDRLGKEKFLFKNNGNVSVRVKGGMVITPAGKSMDKVVEEDLILVKGVKVNTLLVNVAGRTPPSSEAILHWLVYKKYPKVKAIVHFHNDKILANREKFTEISQAYPYGTLELARAAVNALKDSKFILLKDHGPVAVGTSLKACHTLIEKALKSLT